MLLVPLLFAAGAGAAAAADAVPMLPLPAEPPAETEGIKGVVEGTDTYFAITDSAYLNVVIDSSETITLRAESAPEMVILRLEPSADRAASLLTLRGFPPSTTYYKYEDDYHNKAVFTTDETGAYSFTQDLTSAHQIFIQPRKSTKFISDSATGGDCTAIGSWDGATRTCTLLMDLAETVQIDSNNITLDGNGHSLTGTRTAMGVYLVNRTGVTVRRLTVSNFYSGIYVGGGGNNTISGNTLSGNIGGSIDGGIKLENTSGNVVTGNTSVSNSSGIYLRSAPGNQLTNNTVLQNTYWGIYVSYNSHGTTVTGNNVSYNNTAGRGNWMPGLNISQSHNNVVSSNTVNNNHNDGIQIQFSDNNTVTNNTANHNFIGLRLNGSKNNVVRDNVLQENGGYSDYGGAMNGYWYFGYDLLANPRLPADCANTVENTTGSGDRPILYVSAADAVVDGGVYAQIVLCNADRAEVRNAVVQGSETVRNNALHLVLTDNARLQNVTATGNSTGVHLTNSTGNVIEQCTMTNNRYDGVFLTGASQGNRIANNTIQGNVRGGIVGWLGQFIGNELTGNTITNGRAGILLSNRGSGNVITNNVVADTEIGLALESMDGMTVRDNAVRNSGTALLLYLASNNLIYNNNFIDYTSPFLDYGNNGANSFNMPRPAGGNYWSRFDEPSEGCSDLDRDGFCDTPYALGAYADNLPWTTQNGWNVPADTTPPATAMTIAGVPGSEDWYRSPVEITLTATDNDGGTGVKEIRTAVGASDETVWPGSTATLAFSAETDAELRYYAADNAGNRELPHRVPVRIDLTAPAITASTAPPSNAAGWNHGDVTVSFLCTDALSQVAFCTAPVTALPEGRDQVVPGTARDKAGNEAPAHATVSVDRTPPAIVITGVAEGGTYPRCSAPAPTFTATDALSGVSFEQATLAGGSENNVGTYTYTVTASDHAGNGTSRSVSYQVLYGFGGFTPPVTLDRPFKKGSTIPVKFILTDGCGSDVGTARATLSLQLMNGEVPAGDPLEAESTVPDAGNLFRYSGADGQYIYNLATGGLQIGTYAATMRTDDGAARTITIQIK